MRDPVALDAQLQAGAHGMEFFQILRLIENAHPHKPRIGASLRAGDDPVRFGQDPVLTFQASAVGAYVPAGSRVLPRLSVNFFGMFGPGGALPLHLTEHARERVRNAGDTTLAAFADVFHHRMLSLFYRARACAEPVVGFDRPRSDRFADYVGSLCGVGSPAMKGRDSIGDAAKLHVAGLLANRARPAAGLVTLLRDYFGLPVRIEQFVGHWMALPDDSQTRIGARERGNRLGQSTVLGRQVWDCQHKFRIVFGPLSLHDYKRMLPGGESMRRLADWVRLYAGTVPDWDVRLILARNEVPGLRLGAATRLGWTSYVTSTRPAHDADQLLINPQPRAG
ncbi:type VI secretion system baseplate subunit TssG [Massilia sp. P8910]|uniref:type VI secretion system baseplate subunit TssG n=1 Tax=Massilia antarctica TaxID=2765360 RepID=UPI001E5B21D9|nr:type VI secretion system baseplate subunit TssG [Massilia antarctica]MCE3607901.1 type VI secretion system baseplate subunit TssG [Massilia antarctica]